MITHFDSQIKYRIGIDVGESGIGKAAIQVDDDGNPIAILNATVTIIDGGKDPSSGKTPQSRLAVSGLARRTRRLLRHRRKRILALQKLLDELGIIDMRPALSPYINPWQARHDLYLKDETDYIQRQAKLRIAIEHIARHRGWRNPWWSLERLRASAAEGPTAAFVATQERASETLNVAVEDLPSLGAIGALTPPEVPLRPRTGKKALAQTKKFRIFAEKILQEDQLRELEAILVQQGVPEKDRQRIVAAVFHTEKPTVPKERVGKDPFDGLPRVPRTSLEFQEFRIRSTIANLTDRTRGKDARLTKAQRDVIIDKLLAWEDEVSPTWEELASWIDRESSQVTFPISDDPHLSSPPVDKTAAVLARNRKKLPSLSVLWEKLWTDAQRSEFAVYLGETTAFDEDSLIAEDLTELPEGERELLDQIDAFDKSRASYGIETLRRLNDHMRTSETGSLTEALKEVFKKDPGWKPAPESLFDHVDHPVVDRVLTDVGRWLKTIVDRYGLPQQVNVEHVRSAFLGPEAKAEYNREISSNRIRNERARQELHVANVEHTRRSDLRRYEAVQMQNQQCLYCGITLNVEQPDKVFNFSQVEMDHIVPRAGGGSNRRENLVAVCKPCNSRKSNEIFSVWATREEQERRPGVSVAEALQRVRDWQKPNGMTYARFRQLQNSVRLRLRRTTEDAPLDERAMASTAYSARVVTERIDGFLRQHLKDIRRTDPSILTTIDTSTGEVTPLPMHNWVQVYQGRITAEARKSSGVEGKLSLRAAQHKTRFDRRHHAVDAAVISLMGVKPARVLAQRSEQRDSARLASSTGPETKEWKTVGNTDDAFIRWRQAMHQLAEFVKQAIADDEIVVMRPLRLGPNVGALHSPNPEPLVSKPVSEPFTSQEVLRIVDRDLYETAERFQGDIDGMAALPDRPHTGTILDVPDASIKLFQSASSGLSPKLALRDGAAEIGSSQHHVRVYAFRDKKGKIIYAQLRVFAGEFARIGFLKSGVDLFTAPLPSWSQAMRCAPSKLRESIKDGTAHQIGWLVRGDELEFPDAAEVMSIGEVSGITCGVTRERRWIVTGFETNVILNLKPAYLAEEGLPPVSSAHSSEVSAETRKAIQRGWRASLNKVLQMNPTIIRRTASGSPRWRDAHDGLPVSWNVLQSTAKVFGDGTVASS
ncbi:type II CRISPR RNA-guided endonuclease Cas9 [Pseudoclavibacter sp. CFCC 11306]|uniref:type II CRISPR RNA-guided endonuclease Cas9 n=1 Tax=Pseudoclavibacter sp. CFCC 11306 TaxID=1564493 RepID=UPI0013015D34|nr:type II CRISPR RNA-guided endonuclease Cas9 [Pseudoclavibacter sp. CFCC 11306]KAB1656981.1 hypothetical protein F8O09_09250 [Pseudoclavibacter sp. CFCC 11306]